MSQATGLKDYRHEADGIGMKTDPKTTAGRAFVRSLNILLKYARLYGYDHARTVEQLEVAWKELRMAIPEGSDSGLLLGATGAQLLLDGVPLEGAPAEKQFAQLLSAAGLASVQFTPEVTEYELAKLMHAFPTGKAKPSELAEQLKEAIADARGIRVNEICFVATDSRLKDASMAAQIAAASLGDERVRFTKMLNDPQKLLELIAAAEGSETGAGPGAGPGSGTGNGTGSGPGNGGTGTGGGAGIGNGTGAGTGTGRGIGGGTGVAMLTSSASSDNDTNVEIRATTTPVVTVVRTGVPVRWFTFEKTGGSRRSRLIAKKTRLWPSIMIIITVVRPMSAPIEITVANPGWPTDRNAAASGAST